MTAVDLPVAARLRALLAHATAARVVVAREDLDRLLTELAGRGPALDLDALSGQPPAADPVPAPSAPRAEHPPRPVPERRGGRRVALGPADAHRLAAAAWATSADGRLEDLGAFDDLPPHLQRHQVQAARRTIDHLLEEQP